MSAIDLDDQYEIDSKIPDRGDIQGRYMAASDAAVRSNRVAALDVAYGPDPRQRLDILPAGRSMAPAILFFHGGYWTGGAKESRRFPARAWNARGVTWVSVEYRLTPAVTLDDVVADVRRSVAWFHANAAHYGCDASALHVCGNSAGGHIAAMLAADGWQTAYGVPTDVVKSATAISGLFDLEPLRQTFVNGWLKLDAAGAARNSPMRMLPRAGLPVVVSWGGRESSEFERQSREWAALCRQAGCAVTLADSPTANHLTVIGELDEPGSALFEAMACNVPAANAR
jgi:arylformamidase